EYALWFAPAGTPRAEQPTYRRSNAHPIVGEECRAVRESVGLYEAITYARYEVSGSAAGAWLDGLMTVAPPPEGRIVLAPMLGENGRLAGDFTLANTGANRFIVFGAGVAEDIHLRAFEARLPMSGVTVRSLRDRLIGLAIAGPRARDLLARVCRDDVSHRAMPFLAVRRLEVAGATVT